MECTLKFNQENYSEVRGRINDLYLCKFGAAFINGYLHKNGLHLYTGIYTDNNGTLMFTVDSEKELECSRIVQDLLKEGLIDEFIFTTEPLKLDGLVIM